MGFVMEEGFLWVFLDTLGADFAFFTEASRVAKEKPTDGVPSLWDPKLGAVTEVELEDNLRTDTIVENHSARELFSIMFERDKLHCQQFFLGEF